MGDDLMFVVEFEDGTIGKEGIEFQTWDDVPSNKRITAVSLIAGPNVIETLRGYDKYLVCYEAISGMKVSANIDKTITSEAWNRPPKVVAQKLYGFRRYGAIIHRFQDIAAKIIEEINKNKGLSEEARIVYERSSKSLNKKMQKIIQRIRDREIKCISIQLSIEYLSREKAGLNWSKMKEGLGSENEIPSDSEIRNILLK